MVILLMMRTVLLWLRGKYETAPRLSTGQDELGLGNRRGHIYFKTLPRDNTEEYCHLSVQLYDQLEV